jgi:hypothetical protein
MKSRMTSITPNSTEQKLTWVYSDHRQQEVLYRVHYAIEERQGCKIYTIQRLEELE